MPRYDWKCTCGATTEVVRCMAESSVGPHRPCGNCGGTAFTKAVCKPQVHIPGGRSENGTWPVRIPKAEKFILRNPDGSVVRDNKGIPLVGYKDVVFKNLAEQKDWMNRNGKELMMDGEADSTGSDSQHSVYDQSHPAPSDAASKAASNAFFVEDPNEVADIQYTKVEPILVESPSNQPTV